MKLVQKQSHKALSSSFNVAQRTIPCMNEDWHYHSQYELLFITKSSGVRFVGDSVSKFDIGDLVLTGPNLPHLWRNDASYYTDDNGKTVRTFIIKFEKDFLGEGFFSAPEFQAIHDMLDKSKYGLSFNDCDAVCDDITALVEKDGVDRVLSFLTILHKLSIETDITLLSSSNLSEMFEDKKQRLDSIIKHILDNYAGNITLDEVSSIACMTPNSFCRYFKNTTNKTFSAFLNEVRIQNAMRLLADSRVSVKDVCYDVGYKSVTNFNRQFKNIVGHTPTKYKHMLIED